jgi:hypothetical protein
MREGYAVSDLAELLGAPHRVIQSRLKRGLFGRVEGQGVRESAARVTEPAVLRFLHRYPREYDPRRVDQAWLKAMLFGVQAVRPPGEYSVLSGDGD